MRKGKDNSFYGKVHSDETKEKLRLINTGKKHTEETKQKIREARKRQTLPVKNTKPERFLQSILSVNEIKYEIHKQDIFGYPDILINSNICIFIDGCYWHGCKKCGFVNKLKNEKDDKVTKTLKRQGYKIIRIWEHDINYSIMNCFNKIKGEIF
ncbi:hypothetical protein LCGC14_1396600 [marine sediment metagenome]|uniref:Nuclease associated modular domain-containing protein n=1 Tax=marine sediment metagenome TaxID=412755 RepID=A0A0F9MDZ3_9ZZZZ